MFATASFAADYSCDEHQNSPRNCSSRNQISIQQLLVNTPCGTTSIGRLEGRWTCLSTELVRTQVLGA